MACFLLPGVALAGQVTVAVAANFLTTAQALAETFTAETGDEVALVHGSTGKLYAQIIAGAPYDLLLSADAARPALLEQAGRIVPGQRKTYALGRLALVYGAATPPGTLDDLLSRDLRLAIADPAIAPYGAAAAEVLQTVRGKDGWRRDLVYGESVGQAFAFVATGNAQAGLVGLAQARDHAGDLRIIAVRADRHAPIRQDAVLLARAQDHAAARRFFGFLSSPAALKIIAASGYEVAP